MHTTTIEVLAGRLAEHLPRADYWSVFSTDGTGADLLERWFPPLNYRAGVAPWPWEGVITLPRMRSRFIVCPASVVSRRQMLANVKAWYTAGRVEELHITGRPVVLGAKSLVTEWLYGLARDWPAFFGRAAAQVPLAKADAVALPADAFDLPVEMTLNSNPER